MTISYVCSKIVNKIIFMVMVYVFQKPGDFLQNICKCMLFSKLVHSKILFMFMYGSTNYLCLNVNLSSLVILY